MTFSFVDDSQEGEDFEFGVGEDDIAALCHSISFPSSSQMWSSTCGKELQEEPPLSIAELELDNPVCPDLRHGCDPPSLDKLSQSGDKWGGFCCGRSRKVS